jgi:hypothetical protein
MKTLQTMLVGAWVGLGALVAGVLPPAQAEKARQHDDGADFTW